MLMLSTQSEPDLKSTFLAVMLKTHDETLHTLIQKNWPSIVSPQGESEDLIKGSPFVSLAKASGCRNLMTPSDDILYIWFCHWILQCILVYSCTDVSAFLHVGWYSDRCIALRTNASTCSVLHQHESLCIDL